MEKKKYKSARLEGIKSTWSDVEFLIYIKSRIDYRTKNTEINEASDKRIDSIIKKLGESK